MNSTDTAKAPKGLFIKTYGCQMNVYDSERMRDVLRPLGYAPVDRPEQADLVVLNTCHIREKATEKVYSELGQLKRMKEASGGRMTIAVAGCVAQIRRPAQSARRRWPDGLPLGAGRLRQVLHILCCALHAWRRTLPQRR